MFNITIDAGGKRNTTQISADIFNFTNLLNKDWGKKKFVRQNVSPVKTVSTGDIPTFDINSGDFSDDGSPNNVELDDSGLQSFRWQMQLGL